MEEQRSPQIPPHLALSDQQVQARMVSVRALRAVLQMPPQSAVTFRARHSLPLHPNDFEAPLLLANGQKKPVPWRPPSASQALVARRIPEQAAEPARKPVRLKERLREHREMASELLKGRLTRREDRQTADALHPPHEKTAGEDLQAKAMSGLALSADELATLRRENDDAAHAEHTAKLASATSSAAWQSPRLTGSPTRTVPSEELARERREHEATQQQLTWQQHEAQSAAAQAAQAARQAEKQLQLQLIERLGACEVALASKGEQIYELERANRELERANRELEAQLERARHELSAQLEAAELGEHTQLDVAELCDTSRQTRRGVTAQMDTAQLGTVQPSRNELEAQLEGFETTIAQLEASQRGRRHVASAQLEGGQCHVASAQLEGGQCHVATQLEGGRCQGQVAQHDLGAQLEAALARISQLAAQLEAAQREVEAARRVAEVAKPAPLPPHPARLRRRVVRRAPQDDEKEAEAEDDTAATAHASSLKALGIVLGVVIGVGAETEPSAAPTDAMSSPRKASAEGFGVEVMEPRSATPAAALPPPATVADGSAHPAATLAQPPPASSAAAEAQVRQMEAQMRQVVSTMEEQQARFVAELEESHERERQAWERRSIALERTHKAAIAQARAAHAKESAALIETRRQLDTALESAASLARPSDGSSEAPSRAPLLARPSDGPSEAPSRAPLLARQAEARRAPPASPRSRMAPVPLTLAGSIHEVMEKERMAKHHHDAMEDLYDLESNLESDLEPLASQQDLTRDGADDSADDGADDGAAHEEDEDLHALYDAHEDEEAEEAAREIERSRKHLVSLLLYP